jgi:hypothetical protein
MVFGKNLWNYQRGANDCNNEQRRSNMAIEAKSKDTEKRDRIVKRIALELRDGFYVNPALECRLSSRTMFRGDGCHSPKRNGIA